MASPRSSVQSGIPPTPGGVYPVFYGVCRNPGGRRPHGAPLPAQSPVQPGDAPRGPGGRGHRLRPSAGAGRPAPPEEDSPNRGWRSPGFRGFADYLQTPEFETGLSQLLELARERRTAVDVRRSRALALPPVPHRRRPHGAGSPGGTPPGPGKSQPHRLTPSPGWRGPSLSLPPAEGRENRQ